MNAPRSPAEHAEAQRDRILDAALRCFIDHGFHAASMSSIAQTAQMSPGLIYRYFEGKSEIVLAIIERQLAKTLEDIAGLHSESDLISLIAELFACWRRGDPSRMNAALFLETSAFATRDPLVADAVQRADAKSRASFAAWLTSAANARGEVAAAEDVAHRSFALRCFVEGLAVRAVRDPSLTPAQVRESLRQVLPGMLALRRG